MYRVIVLSGKPWALEIDQVEDDLDNIEEFVSSGGVVLLVDDLSDLSEYGIDPDDIEIVE